MRRSLAFTFIFAFFLTLSSRGQAIVVRETTGTSRAFLVIRDGEGKVLGRGAFTQTTHGSHVSSTLSLLFRDGSIDEETSHFIQARTFRLIDDHHVQRGPFFPKSLDMTIDTRGNVALKTTDGAKTKTETSHVDLPPDVTNGMLCATMLNLSLRNGEERKLSFIAPIGKGRMIQLRVLRERQDSFSVAGATVAADVYRVHYELGGIVGVVAPMVGKQPPDTFVWLTHGVPSLVREQGALYDGGPVLSLELAGASFEKSSDTGK